MRFCVRRLDVCPGKEKRILRKDAFCNPSRSYKLRFFVTLPLGRRGATARQPAGYLRKWPNWANALEHPPARLRGGLRQGPEPLVWNLIVFCYSG